jgi:hypothetical protein
VTVDSNIEKKQEQGRPSYLSKQIFEELIEMMAKKVKNSTLKDIRQMGYFSISVD